MRIVGEMAWTAGDGPGVGDAIEYEARVNAVLAEQGMPAACVYPMDLLSPRMLVELLAVHPVVFLDGAAGRPWDRAGRSLPTARWYPSPPRAISSAG